MVHNAEFDQLVARVNTMSDSINRMAAILGAIIERLDKIDPVHKTPKLVKP